MNRATWTREDEERYAELMKRREEATAANKAVMEDTANEVIQDLIGLGYSVGVGPALLGEALSRRAHEMTRALRPYTLILPEPASAAPAEPIPPTEPGGKRGVA